MIILHSLDQSRALRIVWLLEILGTPYRLQTYRRNPDTLLAPDELKAIHPLGKSPLLDDDGFILAESGAITDYLIQTYGNGRLMPERGSREYWQYQRWLHCPQNQRQRQKQLYPSASRAASCPHQQRIGKPQMVGRQQPQRCRHHDELSAASRSRPLRFFRLPQYPRLFAAHRSA